MLHTLASSAGRCWLYDSEGVEPCRFSSTDHAARGDHFTKAARTSGMGLRRCLDTDSERVLRYASEAAKSVRANLTLVHVIPWNVPDLRVGLDLEERLQAAKKDAAHSRIEECKALLVRTL